MSNKRNQIEPTHDHSRLPPEPDESTADGTQDGQEALQPSMTVSTVSENSFGQALIGLVGESYRSLGAMGAARLIVGNQLQLLKEKEDLKAELGTEREKRIKAEKLNAIHDARKREASKSRLVAAVALLFGPIISSQSIKLEAEGAEVTNIFYLLVGLGLVIVGLYAQFAKGKDS